MENNIHIDKNLPLLICDADEVIFNFMDSFDEYLNKNGMYFSYTTFKLNGNILKKTKLFFLTGFLKKSKYKKLEFLDIEETKKSSELDILRASSSPGIK